MKLYRLWFITLFIKLLIAAFLPLSSDESYYWVWSQYLQLSYYDHPPLIAYLIDLGNRLGGWQQTLRWPTVILGHASLLVWFEIIKPYLAKERHSIWLLLLILNPLVGWGSILAIPDTPAIFFWSLSLLFGLKWVDKKTNFLAFAFGAALGLGFLSKYHIVLLIPPLLFWFIKEKKWHGTPLRQYVFIFVTGLLFCSPVLYWNYVNDFVSFRFQLNHGFGSATYSPDWTLTYLLAQIGLLFPTTLYFLFRKNPHRELSWMVYVGWFPILFFLISSFKSRGEGNWPILAYQTLITLAVLQAPKIKWAHYTAALWALLLCVALSEAFLQWLPFKKESFKTGEFSRYDKWVPIFEKYQPFYASTFQMAASLHYKMKKPVYKLAGVGRKDFYDFLPQAAAPRRKLYLASHIWDDFRGTVVETYRVTRVIRLEEPLVLIEMEPK